MSSHLHFQKDRPTPTPERADLYRHVTRNRLRLMWVGHDRNGQIRASTRPENPHSSCGSVTESIIIICINDETRREHGKGAIDVALFSC